MIWDPPFHIADMRDLCFAASSHNPVFLSELPGDRDRGLTGSYFLFSFLACDKRISLSVFGFQLAEIKGVRALRIKQRERPEYLSHHFFYRTSGGTR